MLKRTLAVITVLLIFAIAAPTSHINQQRYYNAGSILSLDSKGGVRTYTVFDMFRISKRTDVRYAYIGGFPIGISLKTDGVLVETVDEINTAFGRASLKNHIQSGDMIISLAGEKTNFAEDLTRILECLSPDIKTVSVKILRGKEYLELEVAPLIEEFTNKFRLGLKVKDTVSGVGTITYIKEDGSFAALGHPICNFSNGECLACNSGSIYDCTVVGISRGGRGRAGEVKATLKNVQNPIGTITVNNKYGIFGKINPQNLPSILAKNQNSTLYEIGERAAIKPGKAQILTTVGENTELYNIEIIKANYQSNRNDKSMVLRVTDKCLLETTGGVVQGMSGSPIIQNNKLIGAVTHVFVNDPTKGYGIYMDWMY